MRMKQLIGRGVILGLMVGSGAAFAGRVKAPNAKLDNLLKAASACPVDAEQNDRFGECPAKEAWESESEGLDDQKVQTWLFSVLETGSPSERALVAPKLNTELVKDGVNRLITAAEKETSPLAAEPIGNEVGHLEVGDKLPRIEKLIKSTPLPGLAAETLRGLSFRNRTPAVVATGLAFAKDARRDVRIAAYYTITEAAKDGDAAACKGLTSAVADSDDFAARAAGEGIVKRKCEGGYSPLVDAAQKLASSKKDLGNLRFPISSLCDKVPAMRGKATKMLQPLSGSEKWTTRVAYVEILDSCDPQAAITVARAQSKGDKEKLVREFADKYIAKKKK
jgi:hypothetical protein